LAHERAPLPAAGAPPSQGGDGGPPGGGTYFLGRYRVVDEIGIGGMASVHLARMDGPGGFQKWVAIKKIHSHLVEDDSFVQMFLDEARIAARISHPNVATVFDLGKAEDTYWIAMEYLHGEPLREVMRRTEELGTAMPPEIACRIIADAAEGLHAAHELLGKNGEKLQLVHRDVTPHNLFVTYDGTTKVVDFGIAKFSSRMSSTRAGTLKGKLAYMSPEQVHGEPIDRRTDIFALGVVLWELTTGQRLFRSESDLDTLAKVQECNVPRPSTLIRGYPLDLEKIVMKALAKNKGERFKTARELSRALQSLLMRRGLFIASDEVANYVQSIFTDRIQKREAHLKWAAEVTQTISIGVDPVTSLPRIGQPESSMGSDVQKAPSTAQKPRPAAGMPAGAPVPQPLPARSEPPTVGPRTNLAALGLVPSEPQPTTQPQVPRPGGGAPMAPRSQSFAQGPQASAAPVPQPLPARAGPPPTQLSPSVPATPAAAPVLAPYEEEDEHPSENDGPTIQAAPSMLDPNVFANAPSPLGDAPQPKPARSTAHDDDVHADPPTVMATPQSRGVNVEDLRSEDAIEAIEDLEDDDEDQDETIVAQTRVESGPSPATPAPPRPIAPAIPGPPRPQKERRPTTMGLAPPDGGGPPRMGSPVGGTAPPPPLPPQPAFPPPRQEMQYAETIAPGQLGDLALPPPSASQQPTLNPFDDLRLPPQPAPQPFASTMQLGGGAPWNPPPLDAQATFPPMHPGNGPMNVGNGGAGISGMHAPLAMGGEMYPGQDMGYPMPQQPMMGEPLSFGGGGAVATQQRQIMIPTVRGDTVRGGERRRPPMWVVAAVSCSVALLVAGVIAVLISSTGAPPKRVAKGSASGSVPSVSVSVAATAPTASGAALPAPLATGTTGVFTNARAGFLAVAAGGPQGALTAPIPPTATAPTPPATVADPSATATASATSTALVADPSATAAPTATATATAAPTATAAATQTAAATAAPTATATATAKPTATQTAPTPLTAAPATATTKPGAMGAITVICLVQTCTQVVDNGVSLGPSPIVGRPVAAGRHTLQLTAGTVKKSTVVTVKPEETAEVRYPMTP
jgi:serine/threonine-protein kinase